MKQLFFAVAALLALACCLTAQSSNVRNTGCPGAPYPSVTPTRIAQPATFQLPASMPTTSIPFFVLGWSSGNTQFWGPPLTCAANCGFYPAPFYFTVLPIGTKNLTINVPNDRSLFQSCFAFQTAEAAPGRGCVLLHGAVSFCIGR